MHYSYKSFPLAGLISGLLLLCAWTTPWPVKVKTTALGELPPCSTSMITPANQTVCAGTSTAPVNFTGSAWRYSWTNSNPAIGLPASGTGDISSFQALNTTGSVQTAVITVTPERPTRAYVANTFSNNVSVIDVATGAATDTIPVGVEPYGVSVSPNGARVYVTNFSSDNVSVIDASADTVMAIIPVGSSPYGISVTPDGSRVYVANSFSDNVSVIDVATGTVTDTIPVGSKPYTLGNFIGPAGCAGAPVSFTITVEPCAAARLSVEQESDFQVQLLGNPVLDQVEVEIQGAQGQPLVLQLIDVNGRLLSQRQIDKASAHERQRLELKQQPAGLLFLRVNSGWKTVTLKVLKI